MFAIQSIRSRLYDWRRARNQMFEFRPYTTNVPFSLIQEKLRLSSTKWNFSQECRHSATGQYLPVSRMLGRIYNNGAVAVRRDYSVLPEAFVGFASTTATPREFLRYMPLNSDFRVYVIENPNGGGAAGFSTFEEMLPHTRAGLHGTVDACGVLKVTTIILNGQRAPYSKWWPQRGIIRVINVLAELVDQIESGRPYEPTKAQRLAWRASARLPFPKPPYFHPIANVKAIDDPK